MPISPNKLKYLALCKAQAPPLFPSIYLPICGLPKKRVCLHKAPTVETGDGLQSQGNLNGKNFNLEFLE